MQLFILGTVWLWQYLLWGLESLRLILCLFPFPENKVGNRFRLRTTAPSLLETTTIMTCLWGRLRLLLIEFLGWITVKRHWVTSVFMRQVYFKTNQLQWKVCGHFVSLLWKCKNTTKYVRKLKRRIRVDSWEERWHLLWVQWWGLVTVLLFWCSQMWSFGSGDPWNQKFVRLCTFKLAWKCLDPFLGGTLQVSCHTMGCVQCTDGEFPERVREHFQVLGSLEPLSWSCPLLDPTSMPLHFILCAHHGPEWEN